jgi:hypothetical protein
MRVLRGRGSELDRGFGFGLVRSLLERAAGEFPEALAGGAQPAAVVFGAASGGDGAEPDLFARLLALYWLVAELSARWPLGCWPTICTGPTRRHCDGWRSSPNASKIFRS